VTDATAGFAATLVDEWARCGLRHAVLAPGSRSTPLALALARHRGIRLDVFHDERSAAFFALGIGRSGRPAVVVCTSGTAAANLAPAVVEAHHGAVPMIVCTANRPPELHDAGAPQTIDQTHLFGRAVRWFAQPGPPSAEPTAVAAWRPLADRAWAEAVGRPPGPVHLDLAFREPLVSVDDPLLAPGAPKGSPWTAGRLAASPAVADDDAAALAHLVAERRRGLVVVGTGTRAPAAAVVAFAAASGWPVLADPISGCRVPGTISTYDALVRVPAFADRHRPDAVVRLGAPPTSKALTQWLDRDVHQVLVDPDERWLDPARTAARRVVADDGALLAAAVAHLEPPPASDWAAAWHAADARARAAIDAVLDAGGCDEGRVARDVVASAPDGAVLAVASSMPVRDVETFAAPRERLAVVANRGANGIDGFVSTALGAAAGLGAPAVALLGDICFLHDVNGLIGAVARGVDVTFVVVDNDGGGIFSFLPQADAVPEEFERLFGTPHGLDLVAVARAHGVEARRVAAADVAGAVRAGADAGSVRVLVVASDRAANRAGHRAVHDAVRAHLATSE
jgi:2-succinyl-5-enolpyruvyl-6-hydroxy-3-cyclohexene-1-carboxylate synthase